MSCSTQLSMNFILLINVKMPTIMRINTTFESYQAIKVFLALQFLTPSIVIGDRQSLWFNFRLFAVNTGG